MRSRPPSANARSAHVRPRTAECDDRCARRVVSLVHSRFLTAVLAAAALLASATSAPAAYPGSNGSLAFVGEKQGVQQLYVRTRGRTVAVLQGEAFADPVWSPLGKRLAVTRLTPEDG